MKILSFSIPFFRSKRTTTCALFKKPLCREFSQHMVRSSLLIGGRVCPIFSLSSNKNQVFAFLNDAEMRDFACTWKDEKVKNIYNIMFRYGPKSVYVYRCRFIQDKGITISNFLRTDIESLNKSNCLTVHRRRIGVNRIGGNDAISEFEYKNQVIRENEDGYSETEIVHIIYA